MAVYSIVPAGILSVRFGFSKVVELTGIPFAPWSGLSMVELYPASVLVMWKTRRSFMPWTVSRPFHCPVMSWPNKLTDAIQAKMIRLIRFIGFESIELFGLNSAAKVVSGAIVGKQLPVIGGKAPVNDRLSTSNG
jgi:hypothetical protein